MIWNSEHGTWCILDTKRLIIGGTTPRNADVWTLSVDLGRGGPGIWLATGKHAHVILWYTGTKAKIWERVPRPGACHCYQCQVTQPYRDAAKWHDSIKPQMRPDVGPGRIWLCTTLGHSYPVRLCQRGNESCGCGADHTYVGCVRCGTAMDVRKWW